MEIQSMAGISDAKRATYAATSRKAQSKFGLDKCLVALCAVLIWYGGCAGTSRATQIVDTGRPLTLSLAQANAAVLSASHGQAHAVRVFRGPDGLIGTVIEGPSKTPGIAWLSPHGDALFSGGELIGPGGTDLTKEAMYSQGLFLRPDAVLKAAAIPSAHGIIVGTGGPIVTVFLDPNCIYCHQLYWALRPEVATGRLRVRYVVVGKVKLSSVARAASLLAAKDPAQALHVDETAFDEKAEEGGYPVNAKLDPALVATVRANNALFSHAGFVGTPAVLYCAKGTKEVQAVIGVPVNIPAFADIANNGPAKACN